MGMATVTGKKAQFVDHYLECRDPVTAAELAGFSVPHKQGPMLMRRAEIRALIEAAHAKAPAPKPEPEPASDPHPSTEPSTAATAEVTAQENPSPGLSPTQREACLHLLLRDTHETTEHYRKHRPEVFTGVTFTPGATKIALRRRGSVQPWVVKPATAELLRRGWIEITARTADDGPTPAGECIYRPTQMGLDTLAANDESRWAELRVIAKRAGALKPPAFTRSPRPDRRQHRAEPT